MARYLSPDEVCNLVPGMTRGALAQLRYTGKGPKYLRPTAKTIVYREDDVVSWLEASERRSTAQVA